METDKNCGIYKITSPTGRIYIEQSVNLSRRIYGYTNPNNYKKQSKLKNSFEKYGVKNHQFDIIEYCSIEDLNCSERFWQDQFDVLSGGLNCVLQGCGEKRRVLSDSARKKLSEDRMGDKNPMYGKHISEQTRERRRNNPNKKDRKDFNYVRDENGQRKKIKRDNRGGRNPRAKITLCLHTGIYYDCLKDACKALNLEYMTHRNQVSKGTSKILIYAYDE